MVDPILNARLDVLEQELNLTNDPEAWFQKLQITKWEADPEDLSRDWSKFTLWVGDELETQKNKLQGIRESLAQIKDREDPDATAIMNAAWTNYTSTLERSQMLFREFLEFIGGLIFRDKEFDAAICDLADDLVKSCSQLVLINSSISVPAARDSLARSLGWMVRVRFPEWTIWTLPFAAYEYAHVVLNELNRIKDPINARVTAWLRTDPDFMVLPEPQKVVEMNNGLLRQRAETDVKEFLADGLATYLMGPAYACAGILLRFDPAGSTGRSLDPPIDSKRAYFVLKILEGMDGAGAYTWIITYLRDKWKDTCARIKGGELSEDDEKRLDVLLNAWKEITSKFPQYAKYPDTGWAIAGSWAAKWSADLAKPVHLESPADVDHKSRLHDVLNAAWICRTRPHKPANNLPDAGEVNQIAEAAKQLCNEIRLKINEQKQQGEQKKGEKLRKRA